MYVRSYYVRPEHKAYNAVDMAVRNDGEITVCLDKLLNVQCHLSRLYKRIVSVHNSGGTARCAGRINYSGDFGRGIDRRFLLNRIFAAVKYGAVIYITKVSGRMRHCGYYDAYIGSLFYTDRE